MLIDTTLLNSAFNPPIILGVSIIFTSDDVNVSGRPGKRGKAMVT